MKKIKPYKIFESDSIEVIKSFILDCFAFITDDYDGSEVEYEDNELSICFNIQSFYEKETLKKRHDNNTVYVDLEDVDVDKMLSYHKNMTNLLEEINIGIKRLNDRYSNIKLKMDFHDGDMNDGEPFSYICLYFTI